MEVESYLRDIKNASKTGRLTFFVGAGISKLSNYPDWKELTNNFANRLGLDSKGADEEYSNEEYLSIPQKFYYSIDKNKSEYYKVIREELDSDIDPNIIHDLMLVLKPASIITTNLDNLMEKAVSKQGLFYDVVARDADISHMKGSKFILKVHGDLECENVVLKEEDYLNYSDNFRLIEMFLKSIFSTNVVVFIGYSLGDYNIKLTLNWVRNLQGDNFRRPYFIYVDNKELSDLDMMYYESKGLNIINYRSFIDQKDEWLERYKVVLKSVINFEESSLRKNNKNSMEYLYRELLPLDKLNSLRRSDIKAKLSDDYSVDNSGTIVRLNGDVNYLDRFNEVHEILNDDFSNINLKDEELHKYELIKSVFKKAKIYRCIYGENIINYNFNCFGIHDCSFSLDYGAVNRFIANKYKSLEENYVQAYFLYKSGDFEKAYYKYSKVAQNSFKEKNYLLYYFSQVNRYISYKGILCLENRCKLKWDESDYTININCDMSEETKLLMGSFSIDEVFESLPLDFKKQYGSFKDLYNQGSVYESLYKLSNMYYSELSSDKLSKFEIEDYSDVFSSMIGSHLDFVIGNYLLVDEFAEFKKLVQDVTRKRVLMWSRRFSSKNYCRFDEVLSDNFELGSSDFYCLVEYFNNDELKSFLKTAKISVLEFLSKEKCMNFARNLISCYENISKFDSRDGSKNRIEEKFNNLNQLIQLMPKFQFSSMS